ncbi:MAG: hypothetical protein M0010_03180 [Actinomycetota bacterium]|nr:hypothetical protein [Actinomycetota bacterium]
MATSTDVRRGRLLSGAQIARIEALAAERGERIGEQTLVRRSVVTDLLLALWDTDVSAAHAKPLEVVLSVTRSRQWVTPAELEELARVLRANGQDAVLPTGVHS